MDIQEEELIQGLEEAASVKVVLEEEEEEMDGALKVVEVEVEVLGVLLQLVEVVEVGIQEVEEETECLLKEQEGVAGAHKEVEEEIVGVQVVGEVLGVQLDQEAME